MCVCVCVCVCVCGVCVCVCVCVLRVVWGDWAGWDMRKKKVLGEKMRDPRVD